MRISGGDARGIRLQVPKGIRPASEKVRQAVFSSLGHRVLDARVLDLYCGSGAYGLEALSRGAGAAVFVDIDVTACRANVAAAGFTAVATTRRSRVERYLARDAGGDAPFDLVFADPPYARAKGPGGVDGSVLDALAPILAQDGRVIWESRAAPGSIETSSGLVLHDDRRYGDTRVSTFIRGPQG